MDISLICSGIRVDNWKPFFDSFLKTDIGLNLEIIAIGPYVPSQDILNNPKVQFIQDKSSPVRGLQIASSKAIGKRIVWAGDDGVFMPGTQDRMWQWLTKVDNKQVIIGKYTEGEGTSKRGRKNWAVQLADSYYLQNTHKTTLGSKYFPNTWKIGNLAYIDREYFMELGGLDCRFETHTFANADFAARCQRDSKEFLLADFKMIACSIDTVPGGLHQAMYDAFMQNDLPLYRSIYENPSCVTRIKIDYDNWKQSPEIWARRFGK